MSQESGQCGQSSLIPSKPFQASPEAAFCRTARVSQQIIYNILFHASADALLELAFDSRCRRSSRDGRCASYLDP
jgi:hypothetical protein